MFKCDWSSDVCSSDLGTPSSITSAPASASARTYFSVASSDGSPAVIYATMPSSPETRSSAKRLEMRVELDGPTGIGFRESLKIRAGGSKCPCPCRRALQDSRLQGHLSSI